MKDAISERSKSKKAERDTVNPESACPEFVCPVCGKPLGRINLPNMESVIEHELSLGEENRIINSRFLLETTFTHLADEKEVVPLEDQHLVTSLIEVEFNGEGVCTKFDILEVHPVKERIDSEKIK